MEFYGSCQLEADELQNEKTNLENQDKRLKDNNNWELFFIFVIKFFPKMSNYYSIHNNYEEEVKIIQLMKDFKKYK